MMYNAKDQRMCTRGVKVSPFLKFFFGGLDLTNVETEITVFETAQSPDGTGNAITNGDHAGGWMSLTASSGSWTVMVRDFWQNFPIRLTGKEGQLCWALFPRSTELQGGESKTWRLNCRIQRPVLFASGPDIPASPRLVSGHSSVGRAQPCQG